MPQWTSYIHPYTLVSISIERAPKLAFLGQREFTQFYFSLWVSPTAIVFLHSFVFLSHLPLPFSRGTCVFRQESPAVRIPPCQVWIILAQWETVCSVLVVLCLYCFWLDRLFTVPLAHLFCAVELYMVFICGRSSMISCGVGGGGQGFRENKLLQCFLTTPYLLCSLLCLFFIFLMLFL